VAYSEGVSPAQRMRTVATRGVFVDKPKAAAARSSQASVMTHGTSVWADIPDGRVLTGWLTSHGADSSPWRPWWRAASADKQALSQQLTDVLTRRRPGQTESPD
jgi:hypothetical protein